MGGGWARQGFSRDWGCELQEFWGLWLGTLLGFSENTALQGLSGNTVRLGALQGLLLGNGRGVDRRGEEVGFLI